MRFDLRSRFGRIVVFFCVLFFLTAAVAQATQYTIDGRQSLSNYVPGAFVGLANPTTGVDYMAETTDPFWGDPLPPYYSYVAVLDTGASGHVICAYEAEARNLPTTGETYSDVGIGGDELFDVSIPTRLKMASVAVGVSGSEVLSNFSSYGDYKLQIRQEDPLYMGYDPVFVNVVGTPVLNQYVVHVNPNVAPFSYSFDYFGGMPVEYLPTELLASAPSELNAASSELVLVPTAGGTLHVPLSYQNFVQGSPPVSTSTNPMIPNIQVIDSRKPANEQSAPSDWLFDTGGMVTMVGRNLATAIGIDLGSETPVAQTTVLGIGGDVRIFDGYQVDSLIIPLTDGDELVFTDIVVFVPGEDDLPADLPGIFGMNLINKSFNIDPSTQEFVDFTNSAFSDWYVVPVPEPGTFFLLAVGGAFFLLRRIVRRRAV